MSLTRQYYNIGRPVSFTGATHCSVFSGFEKNWQAACFCTDRVGTPPEQCSFPGSGNNINDRPGNSPVEMLAQKLFSMKNARKQLGEIASNDATQINPGLIVTDNPDAQPLFENQLFFEKPLSRQPESPETELFRSWLKSNTPHPKASPALLERIRTIPHQDKI
jgi:hypothetical protein